MSMARRRLRSEAWATRRASSSGRGPSFSRCDTLLRIPITWVLVLVVRGVCALTRRKQTCNAMYLLVRGGRHADAEAAGAHGLDNARGRVAAEDEAAGCRVLLHRPAERRLGLPREAVHLGEDHHLERAVCRTCCVCVLCGK
jgi:hypothetical protein